LPESNPSIHPSISDLTDISVSYCEDEHKSDSDTFFEPEFEYREESGFGMYGMVYVECKVDDCV